MQWDKADTIAELIEDNYSYRDLQHDATERGHGADSSATAYYYTSSSTNGGRVIELQAVITDEGTLDEYIVLSGRVYVDDDYKYIDGGYTNDMV